MSSKGKSGVFSYIKKERTLKNSNGNCGPFKSVNLRASLKMTLTEKLTLKSNYCCSQDLDAVALQPVLNRGHLCVFGKGHVQTGPSIKGQF